jgi:predicted small metal-binding protein
MKHLKCKDVSGQTCDFVSEGESDNDVKMKLIKHGKEVHKEMMEGLSDEEHKDMEKKMDELLKQ